jgi:hypothetical protein
MDVAPGADIDEDDTDDTGRKVRNRLAAMAREAEALKGEKDTKLQRAVTIIAGLVKAGYQPRTSAFCVRYSSRIAQHEILIMARFLKQIKSLHHAHGCHALRSRKS